MQELRSPCLFTTQHLNLERVCFSLLSRPLKSLPLPGFHGWCQIIVSSQIASKSQENWSASGKREDFSSTEGLIYFQRR